MFEKKEFADGEFCPLIGNKCITHKCKFFKKLLGINPQTGQEVEEFDCAIAMLPILLVENARVNRQTTAAVDKTATEIRASKMAFLTALPPVAQERILNSPVMLEEKNGIS